MRSQGVSLLVSLPASPNLQPVRGHSSPLLLPRGAAPPHVSSPTLPTPLQIAPLLTPEASLPASTLPDTMSIRIQH